LHNRFCCLASDTKKKIIMLEIILFPLKVLLIVIDLAVSGPAVIHLDRCGHEAGTAATLNPLTSDTLRFLLLVSRSPS
jgi:hypothetical protein